MKCVLKRPETIFPNSYTAPEIQPSLKIAIPEATAFSGCGKTTLTPPLRKVW